MAPEHRSTSNTPVNVTRRQPLRIQPDHDDTITREMCVWCVPYRFIASAPLSLGKLVNRLDFVTIVALEVGSHGV
jgi:hypothetical protein